MPANVEDLRLHGLLIRVSQLELALDFYSGSLDFKREMLAGGLFKLSSTPPVYIERVGATAVPAPDQARAFMALQVHDIEATIKRFNAAGIFLISQFGYEVEYGLATCFRDPFGNTHTILQRTASEPQPFDEPSVYNVALKIPIASVPGARQFYCDTLGFAVQSERFYPPSLPLEHRDGSLAFMIHDKQSWESDARVRAPLYPNDTGCLLIFETRDIGACANYLKSRSLSSRTTAIEPFALGQRMAFIDNAGIPSEIWEMRT